MTRRMAGGPSPSLRGGAFVYTLRAPGERPIKYVGVTGEPRMRWLLHVSNAVQAMRGRKPMNNFVRWILELREAGERPVMEIVQNVDFSRGEQAEGRWIRRLISRGEPLLNLQHCPMNHGRTRRAYHCGRCGERGHNRLTCERAGASR